MRYLKPDSEDRRVKLDLKDKKILRMLSDNSRLPASTISRKVGLSQDAVNYRIKNLEKSGVIQGYRTVVDMQKFNYEAYHVFLQLSQPSGEAEKKLIKKIRDYPFVRAILKFSGKYDLELALIAKNIKEFDSILNTILNDCSEYLNDHEILTISKNYVNRAFPKSFIETSEEDQAERISGEAKIDEKDRALIKNISDDASQPLYKIARKIGISADAAHYRIRNLSKDGVILKFTIAINYAALDYTVYALLLSIPNLTAEKEQKLKETLKTDKNIIWSVKTIGRYNVLIYVCADKPSQLHETLIRIRNSFPKEIKNYETMIAYEEYKYTYFPENLDLF